MKAYTHDLDYATPKIGCEQVNIERFCGCKRSSCHFIKNRGFKANYVDIDNGDEFWISGPKKDQNDRLYGGKLGVEIDEDVKDEYLKIINGD